MTPVELVLLRLTKVKRSGNGWTACCPSHADENPSLSVTETDDGTVLLHCHAGCSTESVVTAAGLRLSDLFSEQSAQRHDSARHAGAAKTYSRVEGSNVLLTSVLRKHGSAYSLTEQYEYDVADGGALLVLRFEDGNGGKTFRVMSSVDGNAWILKGPKNLVLPYRHQHLVGAQRTWILEGEKCVHALVGLGIEATTSMGGSSSARKTDWSCLNGFDLVLCPDHNDVGRAYMQEVSKLCNGKVRLLELPVAAGEDIADFIEHGRAAGRSDDEIRADIELRAAKASPCPQAPTTPLSFGKAFVPFPTDVFSVQIAEVVEVFSAAIGCDPAFVALPLLSAMAAAIGNTIELEVKRGWTEPSVLDSRLAADEFRYLRRGEEGTSAHRRGWPGEMVAVARRAERRRALARDRATRRP